MVGAKGVRYCGGGSVAEEIAQRDVGLPARRRTVRRSTLGAGAREYAPAQDKAGSLA